jgi:transposase-like protein
MSKRRTTDELNRLVKGAVRGLPKGLTISDFCRRVGVAQTAYHRWRERHDPAQVDSDRRCMTLSVILFCPRS